MVIAGIVSFFIGLLTLRLKSHFFAMFTLAVSGLFLVLQKNGGPLRMAMMALHSKHPNFLKIELCFTVSHYFVLVLVYFFLRRFVNSPFGRVLVAVRENEQRTMSLGFNTLHYKVIASDCCWSCRKSCGFTICSISSLRKYECLVT